MRMVEVGPGSSRKESEVWNLKEKIRSSDNVLRQDRSYFSRTYRRQRAYIVIESNELIGFGIVRSDGYISLLGVKKSFRRKGVGKKIISNIYVDYDAISCHTRIENKSAIQFYEGLGFEIKAKVNRYYNDGGSAYYLVKNNNSDNSIFQKIKKIF